jgi:pimeloyl-ACP methyl ester carboxylesterase
MHALRIVAIVLAAYLAGVVVFLGAIHLWLALDRRRSPRCRPWKSLAKEIFWASLVEITIPVGFFFWPWWWRRPLRYHPDGSPGQEPTLLLHGWGQNWADWWGLALRLRSRGRGSLYVMNYWFFGPIEKSAARLGRTVARIRRETGADRIHVVAHSLGGIVTRTFVEQQADVAQIRTLVAIGSPLAGTHRTGGHWGAASRQMLPGCDFLQKLGPPSPPDGTRYHAIWSHSDGMVIPANSGSLHGAGEELELDDAGHLTPLLQARTADAVSRWLDASEASAGGEGSSEGGRCG